MSWRLGIGGEAQEWMDWHIPVAASASDIMAVAEQAAWQLPLKISTMEDAAIAVFDVLCQIFEDEFSMGRMEYSHFHLGIRQP